MLMRRSPAKEILALPSKQRARCTMRIKPALVITRGSSARCKVSDLPSIPCDIREKPP